MTYKELEGKYGNLDFSDFRKLILKHDQESDLAAYYLLNKKMKTSLTYIFKNYDLGLEYSDVLSDFFIYLRDGRGGKNTESYQALEGIRSWFYFDSWVCNVFENFMKDKAKQVEAEKKACEEAKKKYHEAYNSETEKKIYYLAVLISDINDSFVPLDKFIFYRSMLSKLDKRQMIPNQRMAPALGLTYDNYRQMESRIKARVLNSIKNPNEHLIQKSDRRSEGLIQRIYSDFDYLGSVLHDLYERSLEDLECKVSVKALRAIIQKEDEEEAKRKQSERSVSDVNSRYSLDYDEDLIYDGLAELYPIVKVNPKFRKYLESLPSTQKMLEELHEKKEHYNTLTKIYNRMEGSQKVEFDFADYNIETIEFKAFIWMLNE